MKDDVISRQAAMKIRFSSGFDHDGILFIPYRDVEEHLKKLPSVQPRRGKWTGADGLYGCGIYICDQCGKFAMMKTDFCPNCGADMREGGQE